MDPAAVPIHEDDISWNCDERYVEYDDKIISEGNLKFTIILILVFDETPLDPVAITEIVQGGIGCNHTTLRLSCYALSESEPRSAKINILIYGIVMDS
ncbi:uncharacterized protein Dmoj_GI26056 [Drosophila mojavensis]|uniref:Uncharacterized protein n=2 Tax=Drosophila mojavensis TaxID=7230 RepID=A0A0Q9XFT1_DROMO|nr:uncharacterized protein Dmoj_GI26056 [Drosophila mojavensis]